MARRPALLIGHRRTQKQTLPASDRGFALDINSTPLALREELRQCKTLERIESGAAAAKVIGVGNCAPFGSASAWARRTVERSARSSPFPLFGSCSTASNEALTITILPQIRSNLRSRRREITSHFVLHNPLTASAQNPPSGPSTLCFTRRLGLLQRPADRSTVRNWLSTSIRLRTTTRHCSNASFLPLGFLSADLRYHFVWCSYSVQQPFLMLPHA